MAYRSLLAAVLLAGNTILSSALAVPAVDNGFIETSSSSLPSQQFKTLFTFYNNHYIEISGSRSKLWLAVFDEDTAGVFSGEIEDPDDVKSCHYFGAELIGEDIFVFFTGKTEAVAKGQIGLFAWKLSLELLDFKEPVLIDQFPVSSSSIDALMIDQSANGEHIAFVLEPKTFCKIYKHSFVVCDAALKPVYSDIEAEGEFDDCFKFRSAHVTNSGQLIMLYDEFCEEYTRPAFQKAGEYAAVMVYNNNGTEKISYLRDEERHVMHLTYFEQENEPFLFYSWFYSDDCKRVGFSVIDPADMSEVRIHEFDPNVLQPFLEASLTYKFTEELERTNMLSDSRVNAFIDLLGTFDHNGESYFVVHKHTPGRIVISNGTSSDSRYASLDGDIMIVNADGKLVKKIERMLVTLYAPRGVYFEKKDNSLVLYYYSTPGGSTENVCAIPNMQDLENGMYIPDDQHLYKTVIELETFETKTSEVKMRSNVDTYVSISPQSMFKSGAALIALGWYYNKKYSVSLLTSTIYSYSSYQVVDLNTAE